MSSSSLINIYLQLRFPSRRHRFQFRIHRDGEEFVFRNVKKIRVGSIATSFLPMLKIFSSGDPSGPRNSFIEDATSSLSTLAIYPWGSEAKVTRLADQDQQLLPILQVFPCPKGSKRHRDIVQKMGGKEQFPFLVDPNIGTSVYESGFIIWEMSCKCNYLLTCVWNKRPPDLVFSLCCI